jgi:hypothetical protein
VPDYSSALFSGEKMYAQQETMAKRNATTQRSRIISPNIVLIFFGYTLYNAKAVPNSRSD